MRDSTTARAAHMEDAVPVEVDEGDVPATPVQVKQHVPVPVASPVTLTPSNATSSPKRSKGLKHEEQEVDDDGAISDASAGDGAILQLDLSPDKVDLFDTMGMFVLSDSDDGRDSSCIEPEQDADSGAFQASSSYMRTIRNRLHKIAKWENILSLLCLDGRCAFTEKQFNIMRKALM